MDEKCEGLYKKYTVTNNETGEEVAEAFVLKPTMDRHARVAMLVYAHSVKNENRQLYRGILDWLRHIDRARSIEI